MPQKAAQARPVGPEVKIRQENFPVAARILPGRYRQHLRAVYGFARTLDDIGDEGPPEGRMDLLDAVEKDLRRLYSGKNPELGVVGALSPTVRECAVPREEFLRLVEANRRDQVCTRYGDFDQLLEYCSLSANPVGHIVLHVFGAATPRRLALSDRICSALQVIEHCQDIGEDHRRGRVYLPADDLRRFGCVDADFADPRTPTRLRGVLALQLRRAEELLDEGAPLVGSLPGAAAIAVAGYLAGGRATLAAVRRARYEVLGGRQPRPRKTRLLAEWSSALLRKG